MSTDLESGIVSTNLDLDLELCQQILGFSESLAITTRSYCTQGHSTIQSKIVELQTTTLTQSFVVFID